MGDIFIASLTQLLWQTPLIIFYFVGIILSLVFRQRCPKACSLTLSASVLMLVVTVGHTILILFLFNAIRLDAWGGPTQVLAVVGLAANFLQATGLSLLLAAVFVRPSEVRGDESTTRLDSSSQMTEEHRIVRSPVQ